MMAHSATLNGGWTNFQRVNDDGPADTAAAELINILDSVEVPIVVVRSDLTVACFNRVASGLLGLSPFDVDRASRDVPVLAGLPRLEQHCRQAITDGVESRVDFQDGGMWFVVRISPYTKRNGRAVGAVLTFTNVTAFRASVDQAIYEREVTKAIVNTVASPLVVLSADQRIQTGNRAFYAMFGVSREETQGVPFYEIGNGAFELTPLRRQLSDISAGSHALQPVEVDFVVTAKGQRTLVIDAYPVSLPGHPERRILVTIQDITERKQAEAAKDLRSAEELRRSEAFLAEAQRLSLTGSFSWRIATDEIVWSEQLYRIFEFDRDLTVTFELIETRVHPEDNAIFKNMIASARSAKGDFDYGYRLQLPDHSVKYLHVIAHGTRDKSGRLEYIGAAQDVTQRHLAEAALATARSEMARVARVTSLGELAASIAHEVNQPLTAVTNNGHACQRLLAKGSLEPEVLRRALEEIVADGTRASAVIARIRAFIMKGPTEKTELDVNVVIQEVMELAGREIQKNSVLLEYRLAETPLHALADRVQLQQVLLNLIMNAIEAMTGAPDQRRVLRVESKAVDPGEVLVAVSDSGTGFGSEADRIFVPFFTTKATGMGMGLSICRSIIEDHGGRLWATPNLPHGAVLSFTLPQAGRSLA